MQGIKIAIRDIIGDLVKVGVLPVMQPIIWGDLNDMLTTKRLFEYLDSQASK
jgi:hypothetical protein